MQWVEHSSIGISATLFVALAAIARYPSTLERSVFAHLQTQPRLRTSVNLALHELPYPTLPSLERTPRLLWLSSVMTVNDSCSDGKSVGHHIGSQRWLVSSSQLKAWRTLFAERYGRKVASSCRGSSYTAHSLGRTQPT
jgi:hypothetical protein